MRKIWLVAAALPLVAAGVAVMTPLKAADHLDGNTSPPDNVVRDSASDLTDVYAFTPTNRQGRLALIMNVGPLTGLSAFSDKVTYTFEIRAYAGDGTPGSPNAVKFGATKLDIVCKSVAAGTKMSCTGPNGLTGNGTVGTVGACTVNDAMCVFAGKRSDPFFFDFNAFKATLAPDSGGSQFCKGDGGTATFGNFFQAKNVSSIIVEVDAAKLVGSDGAAGTIPPFGVAASTNRTAP
jgi:Domain of unknown function (DUF4331)